MEKQCYFQTDRFRLPEETHKHEKNLLLYMNKFDRRIYSNKKYDSLIQTFFKIIIGTTIGRMTRIVQKIGGRGLQRARIIGRE